MLCTLELLSFFSGIFFFSFLFCTTVQFVHSEQKEDIQIIREIINDITMRHREVYIVNVTYVMKDNRLGCFVFEKQLRKTTEIFHSL